jgi:hypothetical protein
MMHRIEDPDPDGAGGADELRHVRYAIVGFRNAFESIPNLAALGDEVVVGIDHHECGVVHVHGEVAHGPSRLSMRSTVHIGSATDLTHAELTKIDV